MNDLREKAEKATRGPWNVVLDETYCGGFGCTPDGCLGHLTGRGTWVDGPHITETFEGAGWCGDEKTDEQMALDDKEAYDRACHDAAYIAAAHPQAVIALLDERDALAARVEEAEAELARIAAGCITGEGIFKETAPPEAMRISRKLMIERARKYFGNITQQEAKAMADNADWRSIRERITARQALGDHNDG